MAKGKMTRRQVIQRGAAGLTLASHAGPALGVLGANEKIRVAIAGVNGRGQSHIAAFSGMDDVEVVYIVDPDSTLHESRIKQSNEKSGGRSNPKGLTDLRDALEDKSIHVISTASPNHWHSLQTIWACQAGKDVYVEKPLSHNVHEGRVAVQAAKKYGRIVQHGTQRRSEGGWWKAIGALHAGKFGKLKVARALCYKNRGSIGFKKEKDAPDTLNFDIWLGPAPQQPFHENLVHYNWHWFWDTGNGDIGNQGVHQMDVARWGIKGGTLPKSVISLGGRFGYEDQGETANTQVTLMDFGDTKLIFEVRGLPTDQYHNVGVGNIFHCEEGTLVERKFYPNGSKDPVEIPDVGYDQGPGGENFGNFMAAVRSRKVSDLNAGVLEGHYSAALCHYANVSYQLGEEVPFDSMNMPLGNDEDAEETVDRMKHNLSGKNKLDLGKMSCRVGPKMMIDPKTEGIKGNAKANAMMTRNYRAPYVVPSEIA